MACQLALKIVNVAADFSALGSQGCDDVSFGHCLFGAIGLKV